MIMPPAAEAALRCSGTVAAQQLSPSCMPPRSAVLVQPPKLLVCCAGGLPTAGSAANVDRFGARHAEIYNPANAVGQRWSGLLADSLVDRLAHSTAFLTMNGEVRTAGPATGCCGGHACARW